MLHGAYQIFLKGHPYIYIHRYLNNSYNVAYYGQSIAFNKVITNISRVFLKKKNSVIKLIHEYHKYYPPVNFIWKII